MATLIVPPIEKDEHKIYATLGDDVAVWLESNAVWGPGSKFGQPVTVDDEFYSWLLRAYQVFPHGHPREGRRRFKRCSEEKAKGTGKTERALIVAQGEINPGAPARCHGWVRRGRAWVPVGGSVPFPRLIFVASSEDQVQRTAFGRFKEAMKRSPHAGMFHITQDRIVLLGDVGAAGEAYPLAVSPDTADGDLPTWQHVDEPHRWDSPRHHQMFETIEQNTLKDIDADAWTHTTSTAGHVGGGSVEEDLLRTAEAIGRGEVAQATTFFMRRFAPDDMPTETAEDVEAIVREARGPAASWSGDIPAIVSKYFDPKTDQAYWSRVWANQWVKGGGKAFDAKRWDQLKRPKRLKAGAFVGLGFDGARRRDATGLVATDIVSGLQEVVGFWERPFNAAEDYEHPAGEVDEAMVAAFDRFDVWRMYGDPPYWDDWFPVWEGRWGQERVIRWWTNKERQMAVALRRYEAGMVSGDLGWAADGEESEAYCRHVANAYKKALKSRDEFDVSMWNIRKERPDSDEKIDLAMAGCLSWEVRMDAMTAGAKPTRRQSNRLRAW